jgi:hypothetical protein
MMEYFPRKLMKDFVEVAGAGVSFGALSLSGEIALSLVLTILSLLPAANRWADHWISNDLSKDWQSTPE